MQNIIGTVTAMLEKWIYTNVLAHENTRILRTGKVFGRCTVKNIILPMTKLEELDNSALNKYRLLTLNQIEKQ